MKWSIEFRVREDSDPEGLPQVRPREFIKINFLHRLDLITNLIKGQPSDATNPIIEEPPLLVGRHGVKLARKRIAANPETQPQIRAIAGLLAERCPDDFCHSGMYYYRIIFQDYQNNTPVNAHSEDWIANVVLYRYQLSHFIDEVVQRFNLVRSQDERVLDWRRRDWTLLKRRHLVVWLQIFDLLKECSSIWEGGNGLGRSFDRCHLYLAECIYLTVDGDLWAARQLVDGIGLYYEENERKLRITISRSPFLRSIWTKMGVKTRKIVNESFSIRGWRFAEAVQVGVPRADV